MSDARGVVRRENVARSGQLVAGKLDSIAAHAFKKVVARTFDK